MEREEREGVVSRLFRRSEMEEETGVIEGKEGVFMVKIIPSAVFVMSEKF